MNWLWVLLLTGATAVAAEQTSRELPRALAITSVASTQYLPVNRDQAAT